MWVNRIQGKFDDSDSDPDPVLAQDLTQQIVCAIEDIVANIDYMTATSVILTSAVPLVAMGIMHSVGTVTPEEIQALAGNSTFMATLTHAVGRTIGKTCKEQVEKVRKARDN